MSATGLKSAYNLHGPLDLDRMTLLVHLYGSQKGWVWVHHSTATVDALMLGVAASFAPRPGVLTCTPREHSAQSVLHIKCECDIQDVQQEAAARATQRDLVSPQKYPTDCTLRSDPTTQIGGYCKDKPRLQSQQHVRWAIPSLSKSVLTV